MAVTKRIREHAHDRLDRLRPDQLEAAVTLLERIVHLRSAASFRIMRLRE